MLHSSSKLDSASRPSVLVLFAVLSAAQVACSAAADPGTDPNTLGSGGANPYGTGGAFGTGGGLPGSGGIVGVSGAPGTGGAPPGNGCGTNKTFACMNPPLLDAIPRGPAGQWTYHEYPDTKCRDGSNAGLYTRFSDTSKKLLIYLEQGGACFNSALCAYNPVKVGDSITGRTLPDTIAGMKIGTKQEPQTTGIFDYTNAQNPYKDWNAVWIPYCTGDAFGGSNPNATVDGVPGPQQFVGYMNMQKFVGHIVPTFPDMERVVLTGTSAGSFGSGLNFNQVQDAFGNVPVTLIMDSGIPFADAFMSPSLQKTWRDTWKLEALLPPDCAECRHPDGGGFLNLVFYSAKKYTGVRAGIISATEDDIMRFFFGFGESSGSYPDGKYTQGLTDLRTQAAPYRAQFASYYVPGKLHMYSQFPDFYQPMAGGVPMVSWVNDLLAGNMHDVGP